MQRRQFLVLTGLGISFGSLARASQAGREPDFIADARALGKPLVLIVVPADGVERRRLEQRVTELLTASPGNEVSLFARFELACVRSDDARRLLGPEKARPEGAAPKAEPVLLFVEAARDAAVSPIHHEDIEREAHSISEEQSIEMPAGYAHTVYWQQAVRRLLRKRLGTTPRGVEQRAVDVWQTLDAGERARLAEIERAPSYAHLDLQWRGAPYLWRNAAGDEAAAAYLAGALASLARTRFAEQAPAGARWSEEPADPCPACGMGHVRPTTRRFLRFYTAPTPDDQDR